MQDTAGHKELWCNYDHPTTACAQLGRSGRARVQRCLCVLVWISIACISFCFPLLFSLPWCQVESQKIRCSPVLSHRADIPYCCTPLQSLQKLPPPKTAWESQEGHGRMRRGEQLWKSIGNERNQGKLEEGGRIRGAQRDEGTPVILQGGEVTHW